MKKLSVKMKITLWYTGLIVIILSAIFTAVLLATDKVLLLGVQNKLEEEVYDFAEELKVDSNGRLRLGETGFFKGRGQACCISREWSDDHGPCGQRSAGNTLCRRTAAEGRK